MSISQEFDPEKAKYGDIVEVTLRGTFGSLLDSGTFYLAVPAMGDIRFTEAAQKIHKFQAYFPDPPTALGTVIYAEILHEDTMIIFRNLTLIEENVWHGVTFIQGNYVAANVTPGQILVWRLVSEPKVSQ